MPKIKYHFNPKSLSFEKVKVGLKDHLKKAFYIVSAVLVFSSVVLLFAYNFLDSPKEKLLKREIAQYKLQYDILNERMDKIGEVLADLENRDDNVYRLIFEAEPIPNAIRNSGIGGSERYSKLEGYDNSQLIKETTMKLDKISRKLYVQSKSYDEVFGLVKNKTKMLTAIPAIQPIDHGTKRIVSGFGYRIHPIYKTMHLHSGIDFLAPRGTPIYATGDGVVDNPKGYSGYGIVCVLNHGFGYYTLYGHMSRMIVKQGQKVKRGQIVGYVGSTGISTSPHLHYEVIKNKKKINPINYFYNDLSPADYEKVIEISSRVNQSLS